MLLIFDPILASKNGQKLTEYKRWHNPFVLANEAISWLKSVTGNRVNYSVVSTIEENSEAAFLKKVDGFKYTEQSYLDVVDSGFSPHRPDIADYYEIINNYQICERLNNGEIDELWMFGGPWFGFYESRLAGPDSFNYNSPPLTGTSCKKTLPIMGYSYERGMKEIIHDFGHRTEATMSKVYGSWQQNRTLHNWDKFGLVAVQSPSFGYSGCGTTHYTPTSQGAYIYDDRSLTSSFCDEFSNYPNMSEPENVLKEVTCETWGCNELGYYEWWFGHLPGFKGIGTDGKLNDWWVYLVDPSSVLTDFTLTPTPTPIPTSEPVSGDLDGDNDVDIFDYNILIENFGNTNCGNVADIDNDCDVDIFDYNTLIENFGKKN